MGKFGILKIFCLYFFKFFTGKNIQENQHVRLGAYHTLDLALNRVFTLEKPCWDAIDLHRLELCADVANKADVAGIVYFLYFLWEKFLLRLCMKVTLIFV